MSGIFLAERTPPWGCTLLSPYTYEKAMELLGEKLQKEAGYHM
jgi:hypothetical protein